MEIWRNSDRQSNNHFCIRYNDGSKKEYDFFTRELFRFQSHLEVGLGKIGATEVGEHVARDRFDDNRRHDVVACYIGARLFQDPLGRLEHFQFQGVADQLT